MTKPTGNPRGRPRKDAIRTDAVDVTRTDGGYANVFLNVGNARDRTAYNTPVITAPMMQQQLEALYEGNGFARRIVDLPADEMTRAGYEIDGLDEQVAEDVESILEGIGTMEALATACRWAGLYGGALIVMLVDDGAQDLREPLNIEKAKKIERLRVYDRWAATRATYYDNPMDMRYGDVKTYRITPNLSGVASTPYEVHESRCLIFDGDPVPIRRRETNDGWGGSVLQSCYDQIMRLGMSHYWANALLERSQQAVHSIKGLGQALLTKNGESIIRQRIDLVDMSRSVNNTVTIDADGEAYDIKSLTSTGVPDLIDRFGQALSAVTGIPETLLLGKQQTGLSNNGAGALENWYANIGQMQARKLVKPLDRLVEIALYSMGKFQPDYLIKFCPLWVPSDKEKAEVFKLDMEAHKLKADTAGVYVTMQALDPSEVRAKIAEEYEIDPMPLESGPLPEDGGEGGDGMEGGGD
jgi:phage-related protein (TIGR01555 family)